MRLRQYEGMFLFDSSFATDMSKAEAEIRRILDRAEAEIVFCRKWDERRLAYDIKGQRRGTYVLTYFKCRPDTIAGIERDVRLSENILRLLVLQAEHVTPERMNEFAPEKQVAAPPSESEEPKPDKDTPKDALDSSVPDEGDEPVALSASSEDADEVTEVTE